MTTAAQTAKLEHGQYTEALYRTGTTAKVRSAFGTPNHKYSDFANGEAVMRMHDPKRVDQDELLFLVATRLNRRPEIVSCLF